MKFGSHQDLVCPVTCPHIRICVLCHSGLGWGLFGVCVMRLRGPGCGWGVVVVSAAALLLLAALGLALALILTRESPLHLRSVISDEVILLIQIPSL